MLVCASSFFPRMSASPSDGIPTLRDSNADSSLRAPFVVAPIPARGPYSATRIFPSQSFKLTAPLMGQTPLESNRNPTPLLEFPLLGVKSLQVPLMRLSPLGNNTACLLNHSQDRPTILVTKITIPKRRDHINCKKPTVKQARQDLNIPKKYTCFIPKKVLPFRIYSFKYILDYI